MGIDEETLLLEVVLLLGMRMKLIRRKFRRRNILGRIIVLLLHTNYVFM